MEKNKFFIEVELSENSLNEIIKKIKNGDSDLAEWLSCILHNQRGLYLRLNFIIDQLNFIQDQLNKSNKKGKKI